MADTSRSDPGVGLSRLVDALSLNTAPDHPAQSASNVNRAVDITSAEPLSPTALAPPDPMVDPGRPTRNRTFVLFQPDCAKHRYIRNHHDLAEIVERPQRIRAVKAGVAAAWSKFERTTVGEKWSPALPRASNDDELGSLMNSLSLGAKQTDETLEQVKGKSSPFDILVSHDRLPLDSPALGIVHGVPNYPPDYTPPSSVSLPASVDPPLRSDYHNSAASPTRRLSPRKATSALPSTPYPAESPWPAQLAHLVDNVPAPTASPQKRESEIPSHLPQGDLYLCPESSEAIFGALGAVCKGIDLVVAKAEDGQRRQNSAKYENGFVVIRPPGHHCGEANPQGFCFVNNVAVAAAHGTALAHLQHGINKVLILDIDLHHGNGTQEIVWQINEKANQILTSHRDSLAANGVDQKRTSPRKSTSPTKSKSGKATGGEHDQQSNGPRPLQVMYSSLHDVLSYPCESGDPSLIAAASLQISGPHSQFIHNTHLEPYATEQDFVERLWPKYWNALGGDRAKDFLTKTGATQDETLVLVSAGFDASVHEYSSMSRHGLNVPPSFYSLFSRAIKRFAQAHAQGRVVFVLEGGYSDKALASGSLGVLTGLVGEYEEEEDDDRRTERTQGDDLDRIVQVCRLGKETGTTTTTGRRKGPAKDEAVRAEDKEWIKRTKQIFDYIDDDYQHAGSRPTHTPKASTSTLKAASKPSTPTTTIEPRQLRERKVRLDYAGLADMSVPLATQQQHQHPQHHRRTSPPTPSSSVDETQPTAGSSRGGPAALPPAPSKPTAFASIPPATFYTSSIATATGVEQVSARVGDVENGTTEGEGNPRKVPAIKFVWKQGGIGGGGGGSGSGGDMGAPRM